MEAGTLEPIPLPGHWAFIGRVWKSCTCGSLCKCITFSGVSERQFEHGLGSRRPLGTSHSCRRRLLPQAPTAQPRHHGAASQCHAYAVRRPAALLHMPPLPLLPSAASDRDPLPHWRRALPAALLALSNHAWPFARRPCSLGSTATTAATLSRSRRWHSTATRCELRRLPCCCDVLLLPCCLLPCRPLAPVSRRSGGLESKPAAAAPCFPFAVLGLVLHMHRLLGHL